MAVIKQGCGHRPLRAEPKPLAVGDRVLWRPSEVWTIREGGTAGDTHVWAEGVHGRERLLPVADLERIDPAPPAEPATTPAERQSIAAAGLIGGLTADEAIRTLTAQRDRAIDELEKTRVYAAGEHAQLNRLRFAISEALHGKAPTQ